jgi:CubicO group peptidase (beta-lactamase class C family)
MAKTITAMLSGIAVSEAIKSIDDPVATYVPQLAGTEYGKTAIRDLLHVASSVAFTENYDGNDDLSRIVPDLARKRAVDNVSQFNTRAAASGTRFYDASAETPVLGLVLRAAIRRPVTDYLVA